MTNPRRDDAAGRRRPSPLLTVATAAALAVTLGSAAAPAAEQPAKVQPPQRTGNTAAPALAAPTPAPAAAPGDDAQATADDLPGQKLPPAVAAVIDYQRVLRDSKAAQSIRDQVEARRKLFQDQISKEEQRLTDAEKEMTKQRAVLSAEAFSNKREDFQKKVTEVQRMVQDRR